MCGDGGVGVMVLCSGGVLTCWRGDVVRAVTLCACVVMADNELGAAGMAALAPALGNLVSLTSLNLSRT